MTAITTASSAAAASSQPADYSRAGLGLRRAFGIFAATLNAEVLGAVTLAAAATRLALGGWTRWDVVVAGSILALQPFTEWIIHVTVLHWKPKRVGRFSVDPLAARRHRQHHRNPKVITLVLVPRRILIASLVIGAPLYLLAFPTLRLALTAMLTSYVLYLQYEWTHFLIHSSYTPRHGYYRYVHRAHRLHHFRNENYWFGVTVHAADHMLRTFPDKEAVPVSDTASTLGVDVPASAR